DPAGGGERQQLADDVGGALPDPVAVLVVVFVGGRPVGGGLGVAVHAALSDQHPAGVGEADVRDRGRLGAALIGWRDDDLALGGGRIGHAVVVLVGDRPDLVVLVLIDRIVVLPPDAVVEPAGVRLHGPGPLAERDELAVGLARIVGRPERDVAVRVPVGADD